MKTSSYRTKILCLNALIYWGPILGFARDSFLSTFPRLSNETQLTAFSKSHRHLTASHRSRFVERKVRVVFYVRHSNLVYEIAGIKLHTLTNREPWKIKGSGNDKIKEIISTFEVMFVLCRIVERIFVYFEKYFR